MTVREWLTGWGLVYIGVFAVIIGGYIVTEWWHRRR